MLGLFIDVVRVISDIRVSYRVTTVIKGIKVRMVRMVRMVSRVISDIKVVIGLLRLSEASR